MNRVTAILIIAVVLSAPVAVFMDRAMYFPDVILAGTTGYLMISVFTSACFISHKAFKPRYRKTKLLLFCMASAAYVMVSWLAFWALYYLNDYVRYLTN